MASAFVSAAFRGLVIPQLPRSCAARGDYRVDRTLDPPSKRAPLVGETGFNVLSVDGSVEFTLRTRNESPNGATRVTVALESKLAEEIVVGANDSHQLRHGGAATTGHAAERERWTDESWTDRLSEA